ncbi:MAG: prenyltransferase [Isosphaeraceae bacterium]|nr:prenyltransferase [Isosphaeraceae bacterium]
MGRRFRKLGIGLALALALSSSPPALGQDKDGGGFAEPRRGDVPEGAAALITPETEAAIEAGLAWLARQQNTDGSFGSGAYRGNVAVTSLAGLAFMASGSTPGRGRYGSQIDKALNYVMENTGPSGFISVPNAGTHGPMYSHGFGTLFLAEAYGMTHRPEIREKLEKAVRLIIDTQNGEGGWRYQPVRHDADLSVTICQINALRAARNAGIFVPKETVEACIRYVKQSQNPDGGFRYMLQGGASAFPRSAAGVVALQSAGLYDGKEVEAGINYLKNHMSQVRLGGRAQNYFYGHYYAVQAMWIRGGEDWLQWYPAIRDELIHRRTPQGSWSDSFGSEYGTAMALLILQTPNNYLPIFQR